MLLAGIKCKLICGSDLLKSFMTPGLWSDSDLTNILTNHGVVCVERKNHDVSELLKAHPLLVQHGDNVLVLPSDVINDISSTVVRDLISRGSTAKFLVPDQVNQYIVDNNLYIN